jgi:pimeloyl-ACP methyl ester carboxylesterase
LEGSEREFIDTAITTELIETNGINLHTAFVGIEDGIPVILLHGFPDAWFGWEKQIGALAKEGYRVVIPDQRGYNLSDKPEGKENYRMELLVQDIIGLADSLKLDKFHLVGHDFGAMVAWWIAIYYPERINRLVISNVPHPKVMKEYLRSSFSQIRKSWYAFFFRIPSIPERLVKTRNWRFLSTAMAEGLSEEQLNRYREAWSQPNAITSMINWYRAFGKGFTVKAKSLNISVPTIILWGKQDRFLSHQMAEMSVDMCESCSLITFDDASHWVHQDEPEEFNKHMITHLKSE